MNKKKTPHIGPDLFDWAEIAPCVNQTPTVPSDHAHPSSEPRKRLIVFTIPGTKQSSRVIAALVWREESFHCDIDIEPLSAERLSAVLEQATERDVVLLLVDLVNSKESPETAQEFLKLHDTLSESHRKTVHVLCFYDRNRNGRPAWHQAVGSGVKNWFATKSWYIKPPVGMNSRRSVRDIYLSLLEYVRTHVRTSH